MLHFQPEIVSLTGPLADSGKHGVAAVGAGNTGDELGQNHRLSQTGPAEQTRLAAADEGGQEVNHLDPRLEDLGIGQQIGHFRRVTMNGPVIVCDEGAAVIDGVAEQVEDAAQRPLADGNADRPARVLAVRAANKAVRISRATQRTRPPPKCCWTSPVRFTWIPLCSLTIFTAL